MISPNTLLQNRYLVLEQIGKGGMGLVYRATDQRFGSTVALKEIFLEAPHLRKAFEREARLLNHLRHPALPRVSDHFNEDDGQFIVMEFIPGDDLSVMLRERKVAFPLLSVLDWADQLLDALDYLHTHEPPVIHRDIKPQNLKLTARGHIVLLDFGLAKGTPSEASRVTAAGSVFGYSFNYAPLEQMQGTGTDPRSDLYSLGATLYHLMTGLTPPDAVSRATAVLDGKADPLRPADKVQAQVTAAVARVLMDAMAQSAAQRPESAAALRQALREAASQSKGAFVPPALRPAAAGGAKESHTQQVGAPTGELGSGYHPASAATVLPATIVQPALPVARPQPLRVRDQPLESVVTKIRPSRVAEPSSQLPGGKLGILASVILLLVVAVAVYTFTRQSPATSPSVQSSPLPDESAAPTPMQTAPARVENQAPTLSPATETPAARPPVSVNQPADSSVNPPASGPNSQAQPATGNSPATAQTQPQNTPDKADASPAQLTPEAERAAKADEIRRQRSAQDQEDMRRQREEMERERALQQERDMRRREPPPPPGNGFPPPPRRDGPPPY